MDTSFQIFDNVWSLLIFLAAAPALWVSGKMILNNAVHLDRIALLFLWFVLGGFFLIPLIDLLSYIRDLISIVVPSLGTASEISLFWGSVSWLSYSRIATVVGLMGYGLAFYYGQKLISRPGSMGLKSFNLDPWERGFVVLGVAALFNHMLKGILINFVGLRNPVSIGTSGFGSTGFLIGWLLAFMILLIAGFVMNEQLNARDNHMQRN
jgi:hypothetical protein